jgi:transcription elongation factor GreA
MKDRLLKRFYEEIAVLEREVKVELPKEIQRARELGDLRENAEYKAAKERQDIVNVRISMLKKRVGEISMMNLDRIPHGKAGFGSTVHLKSPNGDMIVYQLVMPEEADAEKG